MPEVGRIKFDCEALGISVTCWLGPDDPKPTTGYGGWVQVERPRKGSVTQWTGRSQYEMPIQIVIDGFHDTNEIEDECRRLELMALPDKKEPPQIKIYSDSVPHAGPDLEWVINGIDWGNAIRRNFNGKRVRQEATVNLIRYASYDKVQLSAAARFRARKGRK